ncbi:NAD-dependent epimerase/dehydratase family protein [Sphingobacterium bovistauri]|uniref:NAD-dependent epimerase/dehydratase family protein n=1 Tax=Sphingobacterium bovistauri TaxID=2781959 RepID=A0ABS7Z1R5_9SPHI|nr:NAD-dependent epimerase/dehydratase family protein [Sphingobacterium bovistauri]MCA5004100.1 NAD-dependent epimerase/dehydratase family protein [Sphingobacterium bovistauri]
MKVAITGASGFVGQNLSSYFGKKAVDVQNFSLRTDDWKQNAVFFNVDAIIHLAGKAHDTSNTSSDAEYFQVNRDLTIQLFDKYLESSVRDFFFFSSVKAVADTVDTILFEGADSKPKTAYGRSKFEAEKYILSKELPIGKRVFIIRPCMIHGPGNKGNLNLLYKIVEKGIPWPLASFENERSFLGIDNLSFLLFSMVKRADLPSGIYHFADDEMLSTNELVTLISTVLKKKVKLMRIPRSIVNNLVKIGDVISLPLNSERLKKLTESYVVSNEKIKNALGIERLPLTAKEGLEITISSFIKNKNQ